MLLELNLTRPTVSASLIDNLTTRVVADPRVSLKQNKPSQNKFKIPPVSYLLHDNTYNINP